MSNEPLPQSKFLLYQTEDGRTRIQCHFENETIWLTQAQITDLFQTTPQNVTLHLKAIFAEGELEEAATCKDYLQVRTEGSREVTRNLRHYRLEASITDLFQLTVPTVNEHLKGIYTEGELAAKATIRKFRIARCVGRREVARKIEYCNLVTILAGGLCVRSHRGTRLLPSEKHTSLPRYPLNGNLNATGLSQVVGVHA